MVHRGEAVTSDAGGDSCGHVMIRVGCALFVISLVLFAEGCRGRPRPTRYRSTNPLVAGSTAGSRSKAKNRPRDVHDRQGNDPLHRSARQERLHRLRRGARRADEEGRHAGEQRQRPPVEGDRPELPGNSVAAELLRRHRPRQSRLPAATTSSRLRKYVTTSLKKLSGRDARVDSRQVEAASTHQPWTADRHPEISRWLQVNEKPLKLVHEASSGRTTIRRSSREGTRPASRSTRPCRGPQLTRELATALAAWAMLYAGHGHADAAWADLLACHRLARLVGRRGDAARGACRRGDRDHGLPRRLSSFCDQTKPDANAPRGIPPRPAGLPPLRRSSSQKVDVRGTVRVSRSRHAGSIARATVYLGQTERRSGECSCPTQGREGSLSGIDWDPVLQTANGWFDRWCRRCVSGPRSADARTRQDRGGVASGVDSRFTGKSRLKSAFSEPVFYGCGSSGEAMPDVLIAYNDAGNKTGSRRLPDRLGKPSRMLLSPSLMHSTSATTGRYPGPAGRARARSTSNEVPTRFLLRHATCSTRPTANGYPALQRRRATARTAGAAATTITRRATTSLSEFRCPPSK